jgi:hypothetical protein
MSNLQGCEMEQVKPILGPVHGRLMQEHETHFKIIISLHLIPMNLAEGIMAYDFTSQASNIKI